MAQTIITNHTVKPSSPTPLPSKIHKLSIHDQMQPLIYIPLIFLYENNQSASQQEISKRLRQSLSETLTIFYPIAGTLVQNSHVDCDDTGAEFVEAQVHAPLSHFTQNPNFEELVKQLSPMADGTETRNLSVKTSFFECGGFAVGVFLSHKLADGPSAAAFVHAWGETCRGEASGIIHPSRGQTHLSVHPSFDLALHFPPSHSLRPSLNLGVPREKIATRRLVFDKEKVERIRKLEASRSKVKDPTRVEAVSALLWRSFVAAHIKAGTGTGTTSFPAAHAVNLRPRVGLPDRTFGNCIVGVAVVLSLDVDEDEGEDVVSRLRAAIRGVGDDFMKGVLKDEKMVQMLDEAADVFNKPGSCVFSSWVRFGLYEADFGWGKPARVCTGFPYMNLVLLMEAPAGDGIEAWINVDDERFFQMLQSNCDKLLGEDVMAT